MPPFSLSSENIEQYQVDGYTVVPSLFEEGELATVDQCIRDLTKTAIDSGEPDKIMELEPNQSMASRFHVASTIHFNSMNAFITWQLMIACWTALNLSLVRILSFTTANLT